MPMMGGHNGLQMKHCDPSKTVASPNNKKLFSGESPVIIFKSPV